MNTEGTSRADELGKQGWIRQFAASEPRLSEAVELYKALGFEVHLEPLPKNQEYDTRAGPDTEGPGECRVCFDGFEDRYRIIFTRPARKDEQ